MPCSLLQRTGPERAGWGFPLAFGALNTFTGPTVATCDLPVGFWPELWSGFLSHFPPVLPACMISQNSWLHSQPPQPPPTYNLVVDYAGFIFKMDPESAYFFPLLCPTWSSPTVYCWPGPLSLPCSLQLIPEGSH